MAITYRMDKADIVFVREHGTTRVRVAGKLQKDTGSGYQNYVDVDFTLEFEGPDVDLDIVKSKFMVYLGELLGYQNAHIVLRDFEDYLGNAEWDESEIHGGGPPA